MSWKSYTSLAWTERIIVSPDAYEAEVLQYITAINQCASNKPKTMLHLGCGAGGHDFHFKKHFDLTGVDISEEMLNIAKELNPEVLYIQGDMRTIRLGKKFDVVIIPDSIGYMSTLEDLKKAIHTAAIHLKTGGILLVVANTKEEFMGNSFVYTGTYGNIHVTLFENNYMTSENSYEATLIYLIRQNGELHIQHDIHILGLFSHNSWLKIFKESHLHMNELFNMNHLYNEFLLGEGEYKLKVYICSLLEQ